MQIVRFLKTLCFGCLTLFLSYPLELHAQSKPKDVEGLVQFSIETETGTWSRESSFSVGVKIKNVSDGPIDLVGICTFQLTRADEPSMAYWSPVNILDGTPLKLDAGKVPKGVIHLEPRETKAINLDVSKLFWNRTLSSVWPNQSLFEVMSKGNYHLIFDVEKDTRKSSDSIPTITHITSNKVKIVVR
jgi:hypothetical protein